MSSTRAYEATLGTQDVDFATIPKVRYIRKK